MIKSNPIFEAMGNIDDEIAAKAIKTDEITANVIKTPKQSKRKSLFGIAALAAAALALAVGIRNWGGIIGNYIAPADSPVNQSGASYEAPGFGESDSDQQDKSETMKIKLRSKGDNTDYGIEFNLTLQDYTIPEEYLSSNIFGFESGFTDTVPSELFPKFGITMLTSDNFTDTKSVYNRIHDKNGNIYSWEPYVGISSTAKVDTVICFEYYLYDKNIDRNIHFRSIYFSDIGMLEYNKVFRYEIHSYKEEEVDAEVIKLNDGSQCVVTDSTAFFSYNGVLYDIEFDRNDFNTSSIEELKQVLIDLEIYTPTADTN